MKRTSLKNLSMLFAATAVVLLAAALFVSCGSDGDDKKIPDVSHIAVEVKIQRFDLDLFALDTNRLAEGMQQMAERYPDMFPLFAQNIINDPARPVPPEQALGDFLRAAPVRHLFDTCRQVFTDLRPLEKDLTRMFQFYKYYLPDRSVPQVAAIISEFGTDAFTAGDALCGIGLDMYLGENFAGYNPDFFPDYIRRQFRPEYIPVRLAKALAQNIGDAPDGKRLIDKMLHNGKMLYIVDCLLPETPDSLKMGYTDAQMAGCLSNEAESWARILDQKLLYSTDEDKWRKAVSPSPNAPIIFAEAPGEIGNWLGWRIVQAYMKRHPKTSLSELVKMSDAQQFLEKSKYKPQRK